MGTVSAPPQGPAGHWQGQWASTPGTQPPPAVFALLPGGGSPVCFRVNHRWSKQSPCTPAGTGSPRRGSLSRAKRQARPAPPSGLGAGVSSWASQVPLPLVLAFSAQHQMGLAHSRPVPSLAPLTPEQCLQGPGLADLHLSHHLPLLSGLGWWPVGAGWGAVLEPMRAPQAGCSLRRASALGWHGDPRGLLVAWEGAEVGGGAGRETHAGGGGHT